jgi:hypothetical protein
MPLDTVVLNCFTKFYEAVYLPGCCGLMDVVHVMWLACPIGEYNCAKGREGYPTLAFQCITDYNCRIIAIYGPHFGTRNDKDIIGTNPNDKELQTG